MLFRRRERETFPYEYPNHLRDFAAELPKAPGVYQFHGDLQSVPLYIGKSVNIRKLSRRLRREGARSGARRSASCCAANDRSREVAIRWRGRG